MTHLIDKPEPPNRLTRDLNTLLDARMVRWERQVQGWLAAAVEVQQEAKALVEEWCGQEPG